MWDFLDFIHKSGQRTFNVALKGPRILWQNNICWSQLHQELVHYASWIICKKWKGISPENGTVKKEDSYPQLIIMTKSLALTLSFSIQIWRFEVWTHDSVFIHIHNNIYLFSKFNFHTSTILVLLQKVTVVM